VCRSRADFRGKREIFPKRDKPVAGLAALPSVLHDLMNMINGTQASDRARWLWWIWQYLFDIVAFLSMRQKGVILTR
jgi:hypothetical protein